MESQDAVTNDWLARAKQVFPPAAARHTDLAVTEAQGAYVTTSSGDKLLDFASGVAVTNVGHGHPQVLDAAESQMRTLLHGGHNIAVYPSYVELAERILDRVPGSNKIYFSNSGAEALEGAIKLSSYVTQRTGLIAFRNSFHGRTLATTALSGSSSAYRRHYGGLMPSVHHVDYPAPFANGTDEESEVQRCLAQLDELFDLIIAPDQVAALVVEPFQGEGGYVPAPEAFLEGLRERCTQHGIVLVFDEIQSGFGRTGEMFAWEHSGVQPDAMVLAKGIANGFPLSALVASSELMDGWPPGAHGGTFGGNPVACAASLAVMDVLEGGALANAAELGDGYLLPALRELADELPFVTDVRGRGMMIGLELRNEDHSPASDVVSAVLKMARESGLLLLACGPYKNVLRLMPPTTLAPSEAQSAISILRHSFHKVMKEAQTS